MMVKPRSTEQLKLMRKSGQISAKAMKAVLEAVKPGVTLIELDRIAEDVVLSLGGLPSFKTVPGYRWTTCLTINEEVVHGIPRPIELKEGDVLSIDLGTVYQGWLTDTAWSVIVGEPKVTEEAEVTKLKKKFLAAGEAALWAGIKKAVSGNKIGDISAAIQREIEGPGFSVVRSLVGHGVGRELHEEPEVPGFGNSGTGMQLKSGMTLAIEPIYTAGSYEVMTDMDGWTIVSKDGSLGGLFEMTIIVGGEKAEVLTDWRKA